VSRQNDRQNTRSFCSLPLFSQNLPQKKGFKVPKQLRDNYFLVYRNEDDDSTEEENAEADVASKAHRHRRHDVVAKAV
jgi:hypothetical protein